MIKTNLYITIPQKTKLDEIAADTGMSVAEIVRRALDAYLFTVSPQVASPAPASAKRRVRKAK